MLAGWGRRAGWSRVRWSVREVDHRREDGPVAFSQPSGPRDLVRLGGDLITAEDQQIRRLDSGGHPRWVYRCAGVPQQAYTSADRLLVLTDSLDYHAWGCLGPALLIDLRDGSLAAELRGDRAAAVGDGRFVLGLEGYDVFDTWLHDRSGAVLMSWRTAGHYVVDPDGGIRVVECDRRHPTHSRVVRLLPDGVIERGPQLSDCQVPPPVVLEDGTIVVLDAGLLRAIDRKLRDKVLAELLAVDPDGAWRYHGKLALKGDRLTVAVEERTYDSPIQYTTHHWTFRVHH